VIHVVKPGLLTTVQDLGRYGFAHLGLSPAGAADSLSFRLANLLVGNRPNTPALEITLVGPTLEFDANATVALSGARTSASLALNQAFDISRGEKIAIGSLLDGARTYLAVRGGIAVPPVMNSCATFLPARLGGFEGRSLRAGDRIAVGENVLGAGKELPLGFLEELSPTSSGSLRVTPSLQYDWFEPPEVHLFREQAFTVSDASNRSGVRLRGEPVLPHVKRELLTEGVALGAVQIPPDGQPIILFIDQQTTGGYPKIANVIAADLNRVGQLRPRDKVRFHFVTIAEAFQALQHQETLLDRAMAL
jgi:antagonist of KipI